LEKHKLTNIESPPQFLKNCLTPKNHRPKQKHKPMNKMPNEVSILVEFMPYVHGWKSNI